MELFDMHCHLDFLRDARAFADAAAARGMAFFANTVEPAGYEAARAALSDAPNVRMGVGLHPWWVHDGRCAQSEADAVCRLVSQTRFVGEVGLDLGKRCAPSRDAQVAAFTQVMRACAAEGGKLVSVHAVRAANDVLDILEGEGCLPGNQVVFHWYSDSGSALHRAVRAGCYFSVNLRMLSTRRGREYARQLPADRLLLETDLPPQAEPGFTLEAWEADLRQALQQLETVRSQPMAAQLAETSRMLLE